MHIRSIVIPRRSFASSSVFNLYNPILSWPVSSPIVALLWNLWSQLFDELSRSELGTTEVMSQDFLGFLDGLIGRGNQDREQGHSKLHAIEQHLQTKLRRDIPLEDICKHFHISRATLFRLFKPHGGLKHYVDRLRLECCYS